MKYLMFCLFSFPEYIALILFGLALFKIKITTKRVKNVFLISIVATMLSLFLTIINLTAISTPIQYILVAFSVHRMLNIKTKLSIAVSFSAMTIYGAFQAGLLMLLKMNGIVTDMNLAFTFKGYMVQFSCFIIFMLISYFIVRTKEGFDYEMDTKRASKIKKYTNKLILSVVFGLFLILSGSYFEYKAFGFYLTNLFVLLVLASIVLIYICLKRDTEEAEI